MSTKQEFSSYKWARAYCRDCNWKHVITHFDHTKVYALYQAITEHATGTQHSITMEQSGQHRVIFINRAINNEKSQDGKLDRVLRSG